MKALFFLIGVLPILVVASITTQPYMYLDTDHPESGLFIEWRGGEGTVYYGTEDYSNNITGMNYVHLTGLVEHGHYQWFLVVDGDTSEMGSFQLDPGVGQSFKMALFGDTQYLNDAVPRFFQAAANEQPDLIVVVGDMITTDNSAMPYLGDELGLNKFFNLYPTLFANAILLPVLGNHDYNTTERVSYFQSFFSHIPVTPFSDDPTVTAGMQIGMNYMVDYGNITFSVNNGQQSIDGGGWTHDKLKTWWRTKLDARISAGTLRPAVIGLCHYSQIGGSASYFGYIYQTRKGIAWFAGHTHVYRRTKWLKMGSYYPISAIDTSDVQADSHMVYCEAGQPAWPDACDAYDNGKIAKLDCQDRLMSLVTVSGEGILQQRAVKVLNKNGVDDGDHAARDSFQIDFTQWVSDYLGTTRTIVAPALPTQTSFSIHSLEQQLFILPVVEGVMTLYHINGRVLGRYMIRQGQVMLSTTLFNGVYFARIELKDQPPFSLKWVVLH